MTNLKSEKGEAEDNNDDYDEEEEDNHGDYDDDDEDNHDDCVLIF